MCECASVEYICILQTELKYLIVILDPLLNIMVSLIFSAYLFNVYENIPTVVLVANAWFSI